MLRARIRALIRLASFPAWADRELDDVFAVRAVYRATLNRAAPPSATIDVVAAGSSTP